MCLCCGRAAWSFLVEVAPRNAQPTGLVIKGRLGRLKDVGIRRKKNPADEVSYGHGQGLYELFHFSPFPQKT